MCAIPFLWYIHSGVNMFGINVKIRWSKHKVSVLFRVMGKPNFQTNFTDKTTSVAEDQYIKPYLIT